MLVGIVSPSSGSVSIGNQAPRSARRLVSYLAQSKEIHWDFPISVNDVVLQGCLSGKVWWRRLTSTDRITAQQALARVGLEAMADRPIGSLSGGQQQRVFIARALAQNAGIILLDEPATGLDVAAQRSLLELLQSLKAEGRTVIVSTHDLNQLTELFDHVLCLNRRVVAHGPPRDVLTPGTLINLFAPPLGHYTGGGFLGA